MIRIANRIKNLGTETVFAVSAEANAFQAKGNTVYPFHLGDLNIPTPANIVDAAFKAIKDGKTGYCPNAGIPQLREALAHDINASHHTRYTAENVAIQPGGKPVIGKFLMALMNPGDEVLYPNPGYPIYESQIEFNGGRAVPYTYTEGAINFEFDMAALERSISPATRILILNDHQNPMGAESSKAEREHLAALVLKHDLYVLCDEAYFDIRYDGASASLVSLPGMVDRCVILYTFAKKFAVTGWRMGAAIGPKELIDVLCKLNINDESCSNHFVQYAMVEALTGDQSGPREILNILKKRRDTACDLLNSIEGVRCFKPNVTFNLFPNVTGLMEKKGFADYDAFRLALLHETGVSACTRLHFGRALPGETNRYLRFAYSGIDNDRIREGLTKLKTWAAS